MARSRAQVALQWNKQRATFHVISPSPQSAQKTWGTLWTCHEPLRYWSQTRRIMRAPAMESIFLHYHMLQLLAATYPKYSTVHLLLRHNSHPRKIRGHLWEIRSPLKQPLQAPPQNLNLWKIRNCNSWYIVQVCPKQVKKMQTLLSVSYNCRIIVIIMCMHTMAVFHNCIIFIIHGG